MPGILPMKVIKVGANSQTRIAQACDRCRSKKIRCDGIRPCCSQCANVGFECKTSDKLSRRAFPRGYTESLEERVRGLEQEVRELKDLLDEKDEKIDMLTRIHSQSSNPINAQSSRRRSTSSNEGNDDSTPEDEVFKVQQSPHLEGEGASSYFSGSSSAKTFLEAFKHKVQETGRSTADIDSDRLLDNVAEKSDEYMNTETPVIWKPPPRLTSDQFVNVFFQEWAPLFPILHRPSFLGLYERYVSDPDSITDRAELAQLNLVFGIAALSSDVRSSEDLESIEIQWKAAIDAVLKDNSMSTLQALLLAQIFCVQQGDLKSLLTYKGLSMTLSVRLGLHQSQKRFALGTLTCETRKKVFWTLYTVDCFTATILGTPKQLKDDDIQCEYPEDADDEYVTERGFTPTLPGESTKLSSALAFFRASRILSKVLEEVFPAKASYELSLKRLADLSDELDKWSSSLPPHLHLQFVQDKPSTGTVNSRSPILSMTYHYIRALIQRPVIGANLGSRSSSSMIAMAGSCKHMIQIVQLLIERSMSFSICLNRDEVLVVSGFGLLFQGLNLDSNSKILKDNTKMVNAVVGILEKSAAPCAAEFKRVAQSFLPTPPKAPTPQINPASLSRHNSDGAMAPIITHSPTSSAKKNLKAIVSRFNGNGSPKKPSLDATDHRRATVHNISLHPQGVASQSVPSLQPPKPSSSSSSLYDTSPISRSEPARSPINNMFSRPASTTRPPELSQRHMKPQLRPNAPTLTNLDYLSFGNEPDMQSHANNRAAAKPIKTEPGPTDWEKLIGSLDNGQSNIYDACYGGSAPEGLFDAPTLGMQHDNHSAQTLNDVGWHHDLWALAQTETNASANSVLTKSSGHEDSIFSFSTDERDMNSSNEDVTAVTWAAGNNVPTTSESFRGIVLPELGQDELNFGNNGWDTHLNL